MKKKKQSALLKVNKMRKRIMILNHVPPRDNLPDVVFTKELEKLGHDVFIRSALKQVREKICAIRPHVIITPEIRIEFLHSVMKQCKEWGIQIVVRRGEMGHSDDTDWHPDFLEALYGHLDIYDDIDLELVWGPKYREMLIRDRKAPPKKVKVVGAPFDHYFHKDVVDKVKDKQAKDKPSILVASGFGYADLGGHYCIPEAKTGSPIHAMKVKEHRAARAKFIYLIKLLAISFEGDIHIRVHPGEKEGPYIEELDSFKNVYFCASEFPINSLLKNDLIIHSGSTMGYEAHLLNIPGINYGNFCKDKAIGGVHPFYDDPLKIIADIPKIDLTKSNVVPEGLKHLEDNYFYKVDGNFGKRAAKCVDALPNNNTLTPVEWPLDTFKEMKYQSVGLVHSVAQWACAECSNTFLAQPHLTMIKCPYCGIACLKTETDVPVKEQKGRFSDNRAVVQALGKEGEGSLIAAIQEAQAKEAQAKENKNAKM